MDDGIKKSANNVWDQIAGNFKQFTGEIRKRWGDLTDDEIEEAKGNRDILAGKIQAKYGQTKEEVNRQIDEWSNDLKV